MKFGVFTFPTAGCAVGVVELAQVLEERGFESLFLPEHTHIPVSRTTDYPGGGDLPDVYRKLLDPLIGLAAAASATTALVLGTAVCLPNQRDVITLAKEVSSLDVLSGGRIVFGVSAGWNREELENHGGSPGRRWASLGERVQAMKEIWTNDVAEFHGEFVDFEALWQWPKPVQRPHPPVLVAGNGRRSLQRVAEFGDGWIPMAMDPASLRDAMEDLAAMSAAKGRGSLPVTVIGPRPDPKTLRAYQELGVERCVFWRLPTERRDLLVRLDEWAALIDEFGRG